MKTFKIILIIIVILFIGLFAGIYLFLKNFDLNSYKPMITGKAESVLGRKVDFSSVNLQLSLRHGIAFKLNKLVIGDSPAYQKGDFLQVNEMSLGIDVLSYILRKELKISDIFLQSVRIVVIKNKDGRLNIEDFGQKESTKTNPGEHSVQKREQPAQKPPANSDEKPAETQDKQIPLFLIYVNSLIIDKASLKYIDRTYDPEMTFEISQIDFKISEFSPGKESPFKFDMALLGDRQNIHSSGTIKLDADNQQVSFNPLDLKINLSDFSIEKIKSSLPMFKDKPLPSTLDGQFNLRAKKIIAGKKGLTGLNADADFSNGKIVLKNVKDGSIFELDRINAALKNLSLKDEFTYSLKMAYLSNSPNIDLNGRGRLDIAAKEFNLKELRVSSDLSTFSMSKLKESMPNLKNSDLPEKMEGSIRTDVSTMQLIDGKLVSLKCDGDLTGGKVYFSSLPKPAENIKVKWNISESNIDVSEMVMQIGQGVFKGSAGVAKYRTDQNFNFNMDFQNLELSEILNQNDQSVKIEGKLTGVFKIQGQGFGNEKPPGSLKGNGTVSFKDGKLKDINILKIVLGKLTMFPKLPEILETGLPEQYKQKLASKNTILTKADLKADIINKEIVLSQINVLADNFTYDGTGKALFDKTYTLQGSFLVPENLSKSIVERLNELEYILDEQNRIFLPLIVRGKKTDMTFTVDLKYLTSKIIKVQGLKKLNKLLNKAGTKDKN